MPVQWFDIQEKTFTRWTNDELAKRGMHIDSLKTGLGDGLMLINLMEIISGKSVGRYNKHPRVTMQQLENLTIAINFIQAEGIKLVNISAEDLHSGNMRLILGLIWTLILRYEIKSGDGDDKGAANALLEWIRSKIPEYDIKNFTKDWNDGRAVCALTNALAPGSIANHRDLDPAKKLDNATLGIHKADQLLGVDMLVYPEEMVHPKVDKLAMMTYLAQFRNVPETQISDAARSNAYGPGLVEGIAGEEAPFTVETPEESKLELDVQVEGPQDPAKVTVTPDGPGKYQVSYLPTTPGDYKVHVKLGGEHIPGSKFNVTVLNEISLGGEGKIRVFFSTTSSSQKARSDVFKLESLLKAKKVHLRSDFEPWQAVDLMFKPDRDAVFKKAGTRALPIVFVDDQYVGDYDTLADLEENGKLEQLLSVGNSQLVSEAEHLQRLKIAGEQEAAPVKRNTIVGANENSGLSKAS